MAVIKIPTNFNIDLEFQIPEFYKRVMALAIDVVLEYFYLRIAFKFIAAIERSMPGGEDLGYNMQGIVLLFLLPFFLYHPVMEITMNGQSIGKKIAGIRVVNERGGRPSISQFLIRWLLRVSDLWIAILVIIVATLSTYGGDAEMTFVLVAALSFLVTDIILVVSSPKAQRIGDMLARTIIINVRTKGKIEETVFQEVSDNYVPSFPQIMTLSDHDINAIKSILSIAVRKGDYLLAETTATKIKDHLKINSSMPAFDFLETVLKDYNALAVR